MLQFCMTQIVSCIFHITNNKGADQATRMRNLICDFVVCKKQRQIFSTIDKEYPYLFTVDVCAVMDL